MSEPRSKATVQSENVPDTFDILVATVSWENRFILGLQRTMKSHSIRSVVLLRYREWENRTEEAMQEAKSLCSEHGISVSPVSLSHEQPEATRANLRNVIEETIPPSGTALVDIATMPREAIWTTFFFLHAFGRRVAYVYHKPKSYAGGWLSRDPGRPRFLLQMSGEAQLGRHTVLLVTTGFDPSRTVQLMRTFEPTLTLMALQQGEQFRNVALNVKPHQRFWEDNGPKLHEHFPCDFFPIDAYAPDHGRAAIESRLQDHLNNSNLVMSSLGPKLTSVALYQIHRRYPETALVYAPSREYNLNYSKGIGDTIMGML